MNFSKNIFVTGAQGFIGSSIVNFLRTNYSTYKVLNPSKVELNLMNYNELEKFVLYYKPDIIIHCAAHLPLDGDFQTSREINNKIDSNISRILAINHNIRVLYFSGTSVYKNSGSIIEEGGATETDNQYFLSKLEGEAYLNGGSANSVIFRLSAPYGPKQKVETVMQKFLKAALSNEPLNIYGDGSRVQNFTYIKDVLSAVICFLHHKNVRGIFNICSDASITMLCLAEMIISLTKSRSEILKLDILDHDTNRSLLISNEKARKVLNWMPRFNVKDGITDMLNEDMYNL